MKTLFPKKSRDGRRNHNSRTIHALPPKSGRIVRVISVDRPAKLSQCRVCGAWLAPFYLSSQDACLDCVEFAKVDRRPWWEADICLRRETLDDAAAESRYDLAKRSLRPSQRQLLELYFDSTRTQGEVAAAEKSHIAQPALPEIPELPRAELLHPRIPDEPAPAPAATQPPPAVASPADPPTPAVDDAVEPEAEAHPREAQSSEPPLLAPAQPQPEQLAGPKHGGEWTHDRDGRAKPRRGSK